jgi:hypothetical protein
MDYEYCCGRYIPGQEIIRILPTVVLGYFDTMVRIAHVSCQVSSQFSMTRLKDIANCKYREPLKLKTEDTGTVQSCNTQY